MKYLALLVLLVTTAACSGGADSTKGAENDSSGFKGTWRGDMKSSQWASGFKVNFDEKTGSIGTEKLRVQVGKDQFKIGEYTFISSVKTMSGYYLKRDRRAGEWHAWRTRKGWLIDEDGLAEPVEVEFK